MLDQMTGTRKTTKPRGRAPEPEGRKKSLLTQHGDRAKLDAERAMLLQVLRDQGWNLTHTAEALEMGDASAVLRALDRYGIRAEYEKNRG